MHTFMIVMGLAISIPMIFLSIFLLRFLFFVQAYDDANLMTVCPQCHHHIKLSYFCCPGCGKVYDLTPSEENPHHYQCECGQKLPKTYRRGRGEIQAVCPLCHYILGKNAGQYQEILVPIVGGQSTGKTAFLLAWAYLALHNKKKRIPYQCSFPFPGDYTLLKETTHLWENGEPPQKTHALRPNGLGIDLIRGRYRLKRRCKGFRFYCYDPAGECFSSEKNLVHFSYYEDMDGVIFLVDPFSIPEVVRDHSPSKENFDYSDSDLNDYCDRFLNSLVKFHHLHPNKIHAASCAVVITKADAFGLDQKIGEQGIKAQRKKDRSLSFDDAMNNVCEEFLQYYHMGDVLQKLRNHFLSVRCFSVSSFGHLPNLKKPFSPQRVESPFLWILSETIKNN